MKLPFSVPTQEQIESALTYASFLIEEEAKSRIGTCENKFTVILFDCDNNIIMMNSPVCNNAWSLASKICAFAYKANIAIQISNAGICEACHICGQPFRDIECCGVKIQDSPNFKETVFSLLHHYGIEEGLVWLHDIFRNNGVISSVVLNREFAKSRNLSSFWKLEEHEVADFLHNYPDFCERFGLTCDASIIPENIDSNANKIEIPILYRRKIRNFRENSNN